MAIPEGCKANFSTLLRAVHCGDTALLECTDKETGKPVIVICAMSAGEDGMIDMLPLAKMFDGDPFEEVLPPAEEEAA